MLRSKVRRLSLLYSTSSCATISRLSRYLFTPTLLLNFLFFFFVGPALFGKKNAKSVRQVHCSDRLIDWPCTQSLSCLKQITLCPLSQWVWRDQRSFSAPFRHAKLDYASTPPIPCPPILVPMSPVPNFCRRLTKVRGVMSCLSAPPTVDFRGQLVRRHEALSPWSLTRTVTSLHRRGMSWTAVYWFLWGMTQPLFCAECR